MTQFRCFVGKRSNKKQKTKQMSWNQYISAALRYFKKFQSEFALWNSECGICKISNCDFFESACSVMKLTQNHRSWNSRSHSIHIKRYIESEIEQLTRVCSRTVSCLAAKWNIKYIHTNGIQHKYNFLTRCMLIIST